MDVPGGTVDRNLSANAGDMVPFLHDMEQLSLHAATIDAHVPRDCAQKQEKSLQGEALTLQLESKPPACLN